MPTALIAGIDSIAWPSRVRAKNQRNPRTITTVQPITHRLCGMTVAPPITLWPVPSTTQ